MRIITFFISIIFLFPFYTNAQKNKDKGCEVVMESLKGEYEGGCKKGLAAGEGGGTSLTHP